MYVYSEVSSVTVNVAYFQYGQECNLGKITQPGCLEFWPLAVIGSAGTGELSFSPKSEMLSQRRY